MAQFDLPPVEFQFLRNFLEAGVRFLVFGGYTTEFYGCRKSAKGFDPLIDRIGLTRIKLIR
jgi:hypothetical protein